MPTHTAKVVLEVDLEVLTTNSLRLARQYVQDWSKFSLKLPAARVGYDVRVRQFCVKKTTITKVLKKRMMR